MDAERWQRIEQLFDQALSQPEASRQAFLAEVCGEDAELMAEVLSLLAEDARNTSILDRRVPEVAARVMSHMPRVPVPYAVGPYRILSLLGEGGMGAVYLATREDLGNFVAIKILPHAWVSPERRERFALEQRTLSRLNHPGVARLYDAGTLDDGTPWFAMEYVEGESLTKYCASRQASLDERLRLFRSVCEAVQYAHQQAILHRDLKPSNILVKPDGSVRLLDFGIAKPLDGPDGEENLTRTGARPITLAYASPEQIHGAPAAIQADVYSLGVILFELLSGRRPFLVEQRTIAEAARLIETEEPPKPSEVSSGEVSAPKSLWSDLDVLCLTAMHKDAGRRYPSVEALIRDLDRLRQHKPLEARPDNLPYRFRKFVRRNRRSLAAAFLAIGIASGMAVYFTLRLASARDLALAEASRTRRIQQFMMHLFEGGDANLGPAEDLRVVTLIDRSAREVQTLNADPDVQADLYQTLGNVYQNLGKLDRAEEFMRAGLEIRRKHPGPDGAALSEHLVLLALLRVDQGEFEEAEKLARSALDHAHKTLPPSHPAFAACYGALGRVMTDLGKYDEARRTLEQAIAYQSPDAAPTSDYIDAVIRLANVAYYTGDYDRAESLTRQMIDVYRRRYGEKYPLAAHLLINLGAISLQRSRYPEAERYYPEAFAITAPYFGDSHPDTASTLLGVGRALLAQHRLDEAEATLQKVLAIREQAYGSVHPYIASTLDSLGMLACEQGKLDLAQQHFQREAAIYRETNGPSHHFVARTMANLAYVKLLRKNYDQAESMLRDALARYAEVLPPDHTDVAIARVRLGSALMGKQRYGDAEEESQAGLRILEAKTGAASPWIQEARKNLAAIREALRTAT